MGLSRCLSLLLLFVGIVALSTDRASATPVDRNFSVTSFDRIRVEGPFLVSITTGRAVSARARGEAAAIDRVQLRVEGRTLLVRAGSSWSGFSDAAPGPVSITLTTPALDTAILLGSGSLDIDRITGARAVLTVEGSGRLAVRAIEVDNLSLAIAGAGSVDAAGKARVGALIARGQGTVQARGLTVADLSVVADTASPVTVTATRSARVTASGLGPVKVVGSAACEVRQTGAGPVRCGSK